MKNSTYSTFRRLLIEQDTRCFLFFCFDRHVLQYTT